MNKRGPRRRQSASVVPWAVGVTVVVVFLAVVVATRREDTNPVAATDDGPVHVHGLGVDPKDGVVYAATHTGLFRLSDDGDAERVADRYQDTMGFTVAGAGRFLASGHPDMEEQDLRVAGKPPHLGLIESRDGGRTWKSLSLLGEADFHALAAAHGRIYGHDSTGGRFMTTEDGAEWAERSAVQLVSFAVSPDDEAVILATTGRDMLRSVDTGTTWSPVPDAPAALFISWSEKSGAWAVTEAGELFASEDGAGWAEKGTVPGGGPESLLATDDGLYVATGTGIHVSEDDGRTWRSLYRSAA